MDMNESLVVGSPCTKPDAGSVALASVLSLLSLVTITGNLLTITAFVTDASLRKKPSNLFILSLSCADLLVGFVIPIGVGELICSSWRFGEIGCQLDSFTSNIGIIAGMGSITMIALDRYLLISRQYPRYLALQSRPNVHRSIAAVWVVSVSIGLLEIIIWEAVDFSTGYDFIVECRSPPRDNIVILCILFLVVVGPVICVAVLSVRFLVLLRRRLRSFATPPAANGSGQPVGPVAPSDGMDHREELDMSTTSAAGNAQQSSPTSETSKRRARYIRPAIIMTTLVIAFFAFTLPYVIFITVVAQLCPECGDSNRVHFYLVNVFYLNSCINPFIYAATHPKIRRFHLKLVSCLKLK
ncbi:5-hydroxytryptamine receptor 4-like [Asterias amurensis]|uniref:5-hydroxytryptamine receptor 4-like n=1 Tax=Asterias amurensis TaxID=7602 RepID=UPI003AB8088F